MAAPSAAPVRPASPAYSAYPPPMPPRAAPTPFPAAPPPKRTGRTVAIVAASLLVLAIAAAAVFLLLPKGDTKPLTETEARQRVAASLEGASGVFGNGSAPEGGITKIDVSATPPSGSSPSGLFDGMGKMHMSMEWGRDGAMQLRVDSSSGPMTISFKMTCSGDRRAIEYAGEAYVSRPYVDGIADCLDMGEDEEDAFMENDTPSLDELRAEDADITIHDDGSIHAEMSEDGMTGTLELDAKGRITSLTVSDPKEGTWAMTYEYGSRRAIDLPSNAKLMPADADVLPGASSGSRQTFTVASSPQEPPLSEMEVRVGPGFGGFSGFGGFGDDPDASSADDGETFHFPADRSGPQTQGNYTVTFHDADRDGKLSQGDSFDVVDASQSTDEYGFGYYSNAEIYDTVADGPVGGSPMGMPALGWLPLAGLALGLALLRRR